VFPLYNSSVGILVCGAVSFAATDFRPVRNEQCNEEVLKTQLVLTAIGMTVAMYPVCAVAVPEEIFLGPKTFVGAQVCVFRPACNTIFSDLFQTRPS